jgi:hypothetical protein
LKDADAKKVRDTERLERLRKALLLAAASPDDEETAGGLQR